MTKLFDNWTWSLSLPAPFNDNKFSKLKTRTDIYSNYNTVSKKATLHTPTIKAILSFIDIENNYSEEYKGAIGMQNDTLIVAEYISSKSIIHCVTFNKSTGRLHAGIHNNSNSTFENYILNASNEIGSALIFSIIPIALEDEEFANYYYKLSEYCMNNYKELEKAYDCITVLCDNLYRRIENATSLGDKGININIPNTGNLPQLNMLNMKKGVYSPTTTLIGEFKIFNLDEKTLNIGINENISNFINKYDCKTYVLSTEEENLIPKLASYYVMPKEVIIICEHIKQTFKSLYSMRNFMLRGISGAGKTEMAMAIAVGLGLPYVHITCSANTEISDLLGQMLPVCDNSDSETNSQQKFQYVDTPLVRALKYGYVCEIQEPSAILKPGVLVGLNSIFDTCDSIELPTGEIIKRHPNSVIIITTNIDYEGCKNINQSIISRMDLIIDLDNPTIDTMVDRALKRTGCKDRVMVEKMAYVVEKINEECRNKFITDGCSGMRELISWVQSSMISNDPYESALYTIIPAVSKDVENREEIKSTCLEPFFSSSQI